MKEYDLIVFIGRFQPFHHGHREVVKEAISKADNVLISVGSSNAEPSLRNPLTAEERVGIIKREILLLPEEKTKGTTIQIQCMRDYPTDEAWVFNMRNTVDKFVNEGRCSEAKIGIIGFEKDETSYYLRLFPEWDLILVDGLNILNAGDIRMKLFSGEFFNVTDNISLNTFTAFIESENYELLKCRWDR